MSGIVESLERLLNLTSKASGVLDGIPDRESIGERRGIVYAEEYPAITDAGRVRKEVITVFSYVIITEDGSFEMPSGWPTNGDYPSGTPVPSPLPPSLINSGGLALDIEVQYYQRPRAHTLYFQVGDQLEEDSLLVPMETPYGGYYQGVTDVSSGGDPVLYFVAMPGLTGLAADKVAELIAAGITQVTI